VKLREVTVDDRVSWGFSLAVALAGIAVAWWINLVAGVALLLLGCAGMYAVRVPFVVGRTTHARTALRFLGRRNVIGWTGRQGVRVGGER